MDKSKLREMFIEWLLGVTKKAGSYNSYNFEYDYEKNRFKDAHVHNMYMAFLYGTRIELKTGD